MIRGRVASPTFVGRVTELALLRAAHDAAPGGVFLGGEAGVGKSRLVGEFLAGVAGRATVLRGNCQPGGGLTPYAPIAEALHPLADRLGDGPLARLLTAEPVAQEPEAGDQRRLFTALVRLLEGLAAERPVVLVVEDLHWSDASTRELLDVLLRSLRAPVLVVGTYRDDEVPGRHPLRGLLAELSRLSGPVRVAPVELHRFDAGEARQQIEGILGDTAPDRLVHSVRALGRQPVPGRGAARRRGRRGAAGHAARHPALPVPRAAGRDAAAAAHRRRRRACRPARAARAHPGR